jgi:hypothetical protein
MICPKCECKVCYHYDDECDVYLSDYELYRCAHCGNIFDELEALDDDDFSDCDFDIGN